MRALASLGLDMRGMEARAVATTACRQMYFPLTAPAP